MPIEYKLDILFVVIGVSNLLLRSNRNWIFGYRTARSLQSHLAFAYANTIYGIGLIVIAIAYAIWMYTIGDKLENYPFWEELICLASYFGALAIFIEYMLIRKFQKS